MTGTYDLSAYSDMIADTTRMQAYEEALRTVVTPGTVVLDLGAGTGAFTLLACKLGARRVVSIEPDEAIEVARELVAANGFEDRVDFIKDLSTRVSVPRRADVMVSDIHGILPFYGNAISAIADARERLIQPDARMIPSQDTVWIAAVENADLYERKVRPWTEDYGLDLEVLEQYHVNTLHRVSLDRDDLISEPNRLATLNYRKIRDARFTAEASFRVLRSGYVHGLVLWFDSELIPGVGFSNRPATGEESLIYGQAFLPLSRPVSVEERDRVDTTVWAHPSDPSYVWSWRVEIQGSEGPRDLRQSMFFGGPITGKTLRRSASGFRPRLGTEGRMHRWILERMNGERSIGDIARETADRFGISNVDEVARRVVELSIRFGREEHSTRQGPTGK